MCAGENAGLVRLTNQAGRAGYVDTYPHASPFQPHHAGCALAFARSGELLASTQRDEIRDEMIVLDFDAALLPKERSQPNYTLRNRRHELYGELVRHQVAR